MLSECGHVDAFASVHDQLLTSILWVHGLDNIVVDAQGASKLLQWNGLVGALGGTPNDFLVFNCSANVCVTCRKERTSQLLICVEPQ